MRRTRNISGFFGWFGVSAVLMSAFAFAGFAQTPGPAKVLPPTPFRIGEKLTYEGNLDRYNNIAYAETYVASRGNLGGRDVIELRSKLTTRSIVSAAFFYVDEQRTTFVDAVSGLPVFRSITDNLTGIPDVTTIDNLATPATEFDLLSVIFKIRQMGGTGSLRINENGRSYAITFSTTGTKTVETGAGDFETTVVNVESELFSELGISNVTVNLSADEWRIPAAFAFNREKSVFEASLATVQIVDRLPELEPSSTPATPVPTPRPKPTPAATPTPAPYVDDRPLSKELAFELGERLDYTISAGGNRIGIATLHARERRMVAGKDSLLLSASVSGVDQGNSVFRLGDSMTTQVDPETLAPFSHVINFGGPIAGINQSAVFDTRRNAVIVNAGSNIITPNGTQNALSLLYSMRSFNLKRSGIAENPVNDTRVAVFWGEKPYVFTLRPGAVEQIEMNGTKQAAQLVTITAGSPQIDQYNLRIWLSEDRSRVPLRFAIGQYQFDLFSRTNTITPAAVQNTTELR